MHPKWRDKIAVLWLSSLHPSLRQNKPTCLFLFTYTPRHVCVCVCALPPSRSTVLWPCLCSQKALQPGHFMPHIHRCSACVPFCSVPSMARRQVQHAKEHAEGCVRKETSERKKKLHWVSLAAHRVVMMGGDDGGGWEAITETDRRGSTFKVIARTERQTQTLFFFFFYETVRGLGVRVSSILVRIHPFTFSFLSFFHSFHSFIHSFTFPPAIHSSSPLGSLHSASVLFRRYPSFLPLSRLPFPPYLRSDLRFLSFFPLGGSAGLDYAAIHIYYHGHHWRRQLPRLDVHTCLSLGVCLWRYICVLPLF